MSLDQEVECLDELDQLDLQSTYHNLQSNSSNRRRKHNHKRLPPKKLSNKTSSESCFCSSLGNSKALS
jgi:hypothetical protein